MGIYDEPKIDCHNHVFDPVRFPYAPNAYYKPSGQEIGTAAQLLAVFDAYGVRHALVVGPNSGYDTDNRCLLDVLEQGKGRLKGAAVVPQANQPLRAVYTSDRRAGHGFDPADRRLTPTPPKTRLVGHRATPG